MLNFVGHFVSYPLEREKRKRGWRTNRLHLWSFFYILLHLTLVLLNLNMPAFANSVDPDQLASSEANWSGSALFVIKYVTLYQQSGSSSLIGWQLEVGVVS